MASGGVDEEEEEEEEEEEAAALEGVVSTSERLGFALALPLPRGDFVGVGGREPARHVHP